MGKERDERRVHGAKDAGDGTPLHTRQVMIHGALQACIDKSGRKGVSTPSREWRRNRTKNSSVWSAVCATRRVRRRFDIHIRTQNMQKTDSVQRRSKLRKRPESFGMTFPIRPQHQLHVRSARTPIKYSVQFHLSRLKYVPMRLQHHLIDSVLLQDRREARASGHDGETAGVAVTITRPRRPTRVQGR